MFLFLNGNTTQTRKGREMTPQEKIDHLYKKQQFLLKSVMVVQIVNVIFLVVSFIVYAILY